MRCPFFSAVLCVGVICCKVLDFKFLLWYSIIDLMELSTRKIYHIVHISKLPAIVTEGGLLCDALIRQFPCQGQTIGMHKIKDRRLSTRLKSHPELFVGDCVPFYFCPRSIMLYMLYRANHEDIEYRGGQEPIVHLVADLQKTIEWATQNTVKWAVSTSNASSSFFEDYADVFDIDKIDWTAVNSLQWSDPNIKEKKQAEFLLERKFPLELVEEIGVYSLAQAEQLEQECSFCQVLPPINVRREWYY